MRTAWCARFTFDPVGRLTEEKQPDLTTPSTLVTSKTYTYTDTFPNSVQTTVYFTSATSSGVYRYMDGLGRTIQERGAGGREQHVRREGLHLRDARALGAGIAAVLCIVDGAKRCNVDGGAVHDDAV